MSTSREHITRVALDEARRMKGQTDWARFDAMTDEDIARQVAEDPSLPPLDIDWDKASLVIPPTAKDVITLRVDHDVLEWLRSTGSGYQTRINRVLRAWYEASVKRQKARVGRIPEFNPSTLLGDLKKAVPKKGAVKKAVKPAPARKHA